MCNGSVGAQGAPRVVDRLGIGSVAIGIESFADVVTRHVYVDKTMVIRDLIDRGGVTLFCRPRRFGKSLLLRTLQCYFEAPWTRRPCPGATPTAWPARARCFGAWPSAPPSAWPSPAPASRLSGRSDE